ncbi:MipA/OmpV family protein [Massilia sp. CF038]|uniref:MipA/OmpV family protein n=1 Tax=Massilia sp. CF038 TaxID=1881045 RepID=UPI00091E1BA0|nr:MipA/OmpV family protein [Massilia sp. CF038]SHH15285.1 Outer membrane scaffolding protein for murein synthesis, MipA/OmpV family [Massilia sp. CF038]
MKTFFAFFLSCASAAAAAQTPTTNPMPDGSFDRYIGVGVVAAQAYQGAGERRVRARPLLQFETSQGIFISGMSAGMHLSKQRAWEYGPLLAIDPGRDAGGVNNGADGVGSSAGAIGDTVYGFGVRQISGIAPEAETDLSANPLAGLAEIKPRLQGGVFLNYYLSPDVRLVSTLLYGAGNDHNGLIANMGVQRTAIELAPHHRLTLSAGVTLVNGAHNRSFFGINDDDALASGFAPYAPRGGVRDAWLGAGWNWSLSPAWVLASGARLTLLKGDARHSPLVQRAAGFTVHTGLAYRF